MPCGLYDTPLDEELATLLEGRPDLIATLVATDDEGAPHTYSQFVWQVIRKALPIAKPERQLEIANRLIELLSYDTERTRLHAKAYHFIRQSGFSTAYIGSANMSRAAMTSGLEWTVKVTAQDMPHILARFAAEFEGYWAKDDFVPFDASQSVRFREAIAFANRPSDGGGRRFFADIRPHSFQERILEALQAEREAGSFRNLVVAATGTGKTVMAAFDYVRFRQQMPDGSRLLFIAHRKEILTQALDCFRTVLRDQNFGELLVDGTEPLG